LNILKISINTSVNYVDLHDVNPFVSAENADRHAAARAPDAAFMMRVTVRLHDSAETTPGIDDFSGYRQAPRLVGPGR